MSFEVTVLGSAGSHPGPGRVCSGYLLTADGTRLLLDCGNGATANLQRTTRFDQLDAILVTHRHVDHCVDLVGMFYALRYHPDGPRSVDLYAAPDVVDLLTGLLGDESAAMFHEIFRHTPVTGGDQLEIGPFALTLFDSLHPVPTVSVRAEADGGVLAYSSDSAGGEQLVTCARDADVFLCEATWQGDQQDWPRDLHLTAREAGRVAAEAGARRLVLTHLLGSLDRSRSLAQARERFPGDVALAEDNQVLSVR